MSIDTIQSQILLITVSQGHIDFTATDVHTNFISCNFSHQKFGKAVRVPWPEVDNPLNFCLVISGIEAEAD